MKDIWSRKLECSCGYNMTRIKWRTNQDGRSNYGYRCCLQAMKGTKESREKKGLSGEGLCSRKMVADWKLEMMTKMVIETVWTGRKQSVIRAYELLCEEAKKSSDQNSSEQHRKKDLEERIARCDRKLRGYSDMRAENEITKEEYQRYRREVEAERTELAAELDLLKADHDDETMLAEVRKALDETIDFSQPTLPEYVIDRFIKKIKVVDDTHFIVYIDVGVDPEEYGFSITGRKNNPTITMLDSSDWQLKQEDDEICNTEKRIDSYNSNGGCERRHHTDPDAAAANPAGDGARTGAGLFTEGQDRR